MRIDDIVLLEEVQLQVLKLFFLQTMIEQAGLYEFGEGVGGQGIRLARNAE